MIETPGIDGSSRTTSRPVIARAGWPAGRAMDGLIAPESLLRPWGGNRALTPCRVRENRERRRVSH